MSALRKHCDENLSANERAIDGLRRQHRDQLEAYDIQISELRNQLSEKLDRQHLAYDVEFKDLHGKFDANATAVMNLAQRCEDQQRADDAAAAEFPNLASRLPSLTVDDTTHLLAEQADGLRYCMLKLEEQMIEQQKVSQIMTNHDDQLLELRQLQQKMETRATMGTQKQSADVEKRLWSLDARLAFMDAKVDEVIAALGKVSGAPVLERSSSMYSCNTATASCNTAYLTGHLDRCSKHAFDQTLWEAAVLIGTSTSGKFGSCALTAGIMLNVFLQVALCVLISSKNFLNRELPTLAEVKRWRETVAHDASSMDRLTGMSLASRVCAKDNSLHFANEQVATLFNIAQYTATGAGIVACGTVLLLWIFHVQQELRNSMSFIQGLLGIPRGLTHIVVAHRKDAQQTLLFECISRSRLIALLVFTMLRIGLALWVMVSGSVWLAHTKNIEDLVLNAMALMFILDIDELLYHTILPMPVQTLYEELAPLPRPIGILWRSGGWSVLWNIFFALVCAGMVMHLYVMNELNEMKTIETVMCEGNQNFVVDMNFQANQLFSSSTENFSQDAMEESTYRRQAVRELIHADDRTLANMSAYITRLDVFEQVTHQTMFEMTGFLRYCIDNPIFPKFRTQIQRVTGVLNGTKCEDFRDSCRVQSMRDLRLLCTITCGCGDPRSGLLYDGPTEGCPREICRASQTYQEALASLECRDLSPAELRATKAWSFLFDQWVEWGSSLFPDLAPQYEVVRKVFFAYGCAAIHINRMDTISQKTFCEDTNSQTSIRAFCPVSCGCREQMASNCPLACANRSTG